MLYEDVVLGGSRTSQYSPRVGEGYFLIEIIAVLKKIFSLILLPTSVSHWTLTGSLPGTGEDRWTK